MSTPLTAFVTGATGLLGHNLVRALLAQGHQVVALSRSLAKAQQQFTGLPVQHVIGDMTRVDAFAHHLQGVDVVFHAAAYFRDSYQGGQHRNALMAVNVEGTRALLRAATQHGVRRWVQISSIAVLDGAPGQVITEDMRRHEADADDYYLSKMRCDQVLDEHLASHPDFWAAFVLPGWMHGPGDAGPTSAGQFVLDVLHRRLPAIPPGTVSLVDARDVAQAALAVVERGTRGERYLAAGRHMDMGELLQALSRVAHVPVPRRRMPLAVLRALALLGEWRARLDGTPLLISRATVRLMAREAERTRFDPRKSEHALGLRFRPLDDTLRDEVAWLRAQGLASGTLAP